MARTLVQRAARYFGIGDDEDWKPIKTGRSDCILVADRGRPNGGRVIAYYSEEFGPGRGDYIWLTAQQREALVDALAADSPSAPRIRAKEDHDG